MISNPVNLEWLIVVIANDNGVLDRYTDTEGTIKRVIDVVEQQFESDDLAIAMGYLQSLHDISYDTFESFILDDPLEHNLEQSAAYFEANDLLEAIYNEVVDSD